MQKVAEQAELILFDEAVEEFGIAALQPLRHDLGVIAHECGEAYRRRSCIRCSCSRCPNWKDRDHLISRVCRYKPRDLLTRIRARREKDAGRAEQGALPTPVFCLKECGSDRK